MDFLDFTSYDTETWTTFLKDNWLVLAIGLVVLLLVIRIVKTVMKWAIVAVVVVGLVVYSGYSLDDVKEIGTKVMDNFDVDKMKQDAIGAMVGDASDAEYTVNEDGTYTVKTDDIELKGEVGVSEVQVSLHGLPYVTLQLEGVIQTFIDQAKQNS